MNTSLLSVNSDTLHHGFGIQLQFPSPQLQLDAPALQLQLPAPQLQFVPLEQFIPAPQLIPSKQGQLQFVAPSELQLQLQFPVPQLQLLNENKFFLSNTCFASEKTIGFTKFCFMFSSFPVSLKGNETNYNYTYNCSCNYHLFPVHHTTQMKTTVSVSKFARPHKNRCCL